MKEIIVIGIGQCGIGIAQEFIKQLNYDHFLDNQNKIVNQDRNNQNLNVFFNENSNQSYIPRALFIDLDTRAIDKVLLQNYFQVDPNSCFSSKFGSLNNCAIGKYTDGAILFDKCSDQLRKLFENSDKIQGVFLFHSTGGGTGAGLTYKFIQYFRETDLTKIVHCNAVYPRGLEMSALQIYNTVMIMNNMIETVDYVSVFDNEALSKVCLNNNKDSTFENFNTLIAESLIQTTASYRFPGQLNGSMRKLGLNMIPFPRLHFFQPSYMPLISKDWNISQILNKKYKLCSFEEISNEFLTFQTQLRGNFEMPESLNLQINRENLYKLPGLESDFKVHTAIPHRDYENVIGFLGNSGAFKDYLNSFSSQMTNLFRKRAFLHVYTGVGIDEFEFTEAESNLNDLISEYAPYGHSCDHSDYGYEEEEEIY